MRDEVKDVLRMQGEVQSRGLAETIGDNTIDNMMDEMVRSANIELDRFVVSLLNSNLKIFAQCYNLPQHEDFRIVFRKILYRYQIMDGSEQGDLYVKIENMFKDIFINKYNQMGTDISELLARKYATQMIDILRGNAVQANVDMAQDKTDAYY